MIGLAGPDHLLDALVVGRRPFDVVDVKGDVAAVEHGVLRDADVDEGQFHARQDVLDPPDVDVAVDLVGLVGGLGDGVLDHRAPLEGGDVRRLLGRVHAHQVAALGAGTALAAAATLVLAAPGGRSRHRRPRAPTPRRGRRTDAAGRALLTRPGALPLPPWPPRPRPPRRRRFRRPGRPGRLGRLDGWPLDDAGLPGSGVAYLGCGSGVANAGTRR